MPRILVADTLAAAGLEVLQAEGDVTVRTGMAPQALIECVGDFDALVVRSATKVTRAVLEAGTRLRVVGRAGVGVDNIDVDEATRRGVVVVNSAGASTIADDDHRPQQQVQALVPTHPPNPHHEGHARVRGFHRGLRRRHLDAVRRKRDRPVTVHGGRVPGGFPSTFW